MLNIYPRTFIDRKTEIEYRSCLTYKIYIPILVVVSIISLLGFSVYSYSENLDNYSEYKTACYHEKQFMDILRYFMVMVFPTIFLLIIVVTKKLMKTSPLFFGIIAFILTLSGIVNLILVGIAIGHYTSSSICANFIKNNAIYDWGTILLIVSYIPISVIEVFIMVVTKRIVDSI